MKKVTKLILVNIIILLILLFALEGILRILGHRSYSKGPKPEITVSPGGKYYQKDSLLGYKQIPGSYQIKIKEDFTFMVTHDSFGRRLTGQAPWTLSLSKRPGNTKPEIWIFGCSLTYGFSLNDEESFPWRLQEKLKKYKLTNFGVNAYGSLQFYLQLKEALKSETKPAFIIVNHSDLHHERNSFSYNYRSAVSKMNYLGTLNRPYADLSGDSLAMRYSDEEYQPWSIAKYSALLYMIEKKYESWLDGRMHHKNLKITELIYDEIHDLCKQNKIELVVTNIDLDPDFIQNYCAKRDIPFVDISVNRQLPEYNNLPYDKHPNALANQLYADRLFGYLKENEEINLKNNR